MAVSATTTGTSIGVDFGTLSGRALVVRVSRRSRAGHRGARIPARGHGRDAAAPAAQPLPPDWALQDPADYVDVLRKAVPAAIGPPASTRRR